MQNVGILFIIHLYLCFWPLACPVSLLFGDGFLAIGNWFQKSDVVYSCKQFEGQIAEVLMLSYMESQ